MGLGESSHLSAMWRLSTAPPCQYRPPVSWWEKKKTLQSFPLESKCSCLEVSCVTSTACMKASTLVFSNLKGAISYDQSLAIRRKTRHIEKWLLHLFWHQSNRWGRIITEDSEGKAFQPERTAKVKAPGENDRGVLRNGDERIMSLGERRGGVWERQRPHHKGPVSILQSSDFILGTMGITWEHFKQRTDRSKLSF